MLQRNISGYAVVIPTLDPPVKVEAGGEFDHPTPLAGFEVCSDAYPTVEAPEGPPAPEAALEPDPAPAAPVEPPPAPPAPPAPAAPAVPVWPAPAAPPSAAPGGTVTTA